VVAAALRVGDVDVDVRLRDVVEADLEFFPAHQHDPEAVRRPGFTLRPREAFPRNWKADILGDDTVLVRSVTVDGDVAGNLVAWWDGDRRFLGYRRGRTSWGRGSEAGPSPPSVVVVRLSEHPVRPPPGLGDRPSSREGSRTPPPA
jgi:hypothetical protein